MKKTKLALAVSLATLLATGCGSSDGPQTVVTDPNTGTPTDPVTPDPTTPETGMSVALTDTTTDNTGKLTYDFDEVIESGSVSVKVKYAAGETETSYVTINGDADTIANIKMDSGYTKVDGQVGIKLATSAEDFLTTATFAEDTWVTINVSWNGTDYTVSVDETEIGTYPQLVTEFASSVQMKIGNNSNTTDYSFHVDDLEVYKTTVSTNSFSVKTTTDATLMFSDDFESYTAGDPLAFALYNAAETNEATIVGTKEETDPVVDPITDPETDFPATVDEFKLSGVDYTNSGSANTVVTTAKATGSAGYTATTGAYGDVDTAISMDQTAGYGYFYYTSEEGAGADQLTGSFSTETVIQITERTITSDVALIDYADTSNYLGFKTYLESADNSVKFKIYGGMTEAGNLSSEVKSSDAGVTLTTGEWYHIVSVYDAEDGSEFGTIKLYINGAEVDSNELGYLPADNVATDKFIMMGGSSSSDKNLDGAVDNVATWNVALDATQVATRAATFGL